MVKYLKQFNLHSLYRFDLDKKFRELIGCLTFDSDSHLSLSTGGHNIDTDGSLESFISLWNLCTWACIVISMIVLLLYAARKIQINISGDP